MFTNCRAAILILLALCLGLAAPWAWFTHGYFLPMLIGMSFLVFCIEKVSFKQLVILATLIGLPVQYQTLSWLFDFQSQFEQPDIGYEALYPVYGLIMVQQFLFATLFPAISSFLLVKRFNVMSSLWAVPVIFTLFEALRARAFTGFTLGQPGYGMLDSVWSGILPVTGLLGLTFITWLLVTIVTLGLIVFIEHWQEIRIRLVYDEFKPIRKFERSGKTGTGLISFLGALSLLSALPFLTEIVWNQPLPAMKISVIHENADLDMKATALGRQQRFDHLHSLSMENADTELILWPEGSVSAGTGFYGQVQQLAEELYKAEGETELLFGGYHYWEDSEYNSVMRGRDLKSVYKKKHLIPFGEYVPDTWLTGFVGTALDSLDHAQLKAGPDVQPDITVGDIRLRAFICFEVMFGHSLINLQEDANVLLYFNDLGWVRGSLLLPQSLTMARARAMELAKPLVAVSNMGVSAHIKHDGEVIHFEAGTDAKALHYTITPQSGITPYARYGDQPLITGFILLMMFGIAFRLVRLRYKEI